MRPIIRVENISKKFQLSKGLPVDTLKESLTKMIKSPRQTINARRESEVFWSLQQISFDVMPGECVGIIGPNGSGKSTLLKLLARIMEPTDGLIEIYGKVSSLLEIGTGFHPDLTGRENIYMNGAVLGMTKREIDKKFDAIVEFSEVSQFLDMPVKYFSSGMQVRLAFSVAAYLDSPILLLDEVFAVGDLNFQQKCETKMAELLESGRTMLMVSHSEAVIEQYCDRVMLLKQGRLIGVGSAAEMLRDYRRICN